MKTTIIYWADTCWAQCWILVIYSLIRSPKETREVLVLPLFFISLELLLFQMKSFVSARTKSRWGCVAGGRKQGIPVMHHSLHIQSLHLTNFIFNGRYRNTFFSFTPHSEFGFWFLCYKSVLSQYGNIMKWVFDYDSIRLISAFKRGKERLSKWKIGPLKFFFGPAYFNLANTILWISMYGAKIFFNANIFLENQ